MSAKEVTVNNENSLKRWTSSLVRKMTKQQRRKQPKSAKYSYWDNELSTDSFLELSSEVMPIDTCQSAEDGKFPLPEENVLENETCWESDSQQKFSDLTRILEDTLCAASNERRGFHLKFPPDLTRRLAKAIVETAASEPCGLRGCCVNLRMLHEDIVSALMVSENDENVASQARFEKCASWSDTPVTVEEMRSTSSGPHRSILHFTALPDMDATLTESFCQDKSTDSGFAENSEIKRRRRILRPSLSSSSMPQLPSLSAASRLHAACADLGQLDLCGSDSVPTFEIFVYLAPTTSWTWWFRKLFFSSLNVGKSQQLKEGSFSPSRRSLSVAPDFTLVKKKLYRTHSNSLEVIRCPPEF